MEVVVKLLHLEILVELLKDFVRLKVAILEERVIVQIPVADVATFQLDQPLSVFKA